MDSVEKKSIIFNKKITQILYVFFLFVMIITLRLSYLQIHQGQKFLSKGTSNFLRVEVLNSPRGSVFDVNGNLLATNRPVFDIYWEGHGLSSLNFDQSKVLEKLTGILDQALPIAKIKSAEKFSRKIKICEDISFEELSQISEQCPDCSNLVIVKQFKRIYPYGSLASHLLGYLTKKEGKYGLEKLYQDYLEGESGYVLRVTNSTGRHLEEREHKSAQAGESISLTINKNMQIMAESLFQEGRSGTFIVMDPEDGSIKAMVSYPGFDPNLFLNPISTDDWSNLSSQSSPFLNRAINALYPPASIFKLVTFTAGLEEGVIDGDTEFDCKGYMKFCGRNYNCIRRYGHGILTCRDALAHSCNIHCYEIAKRIKIDDLASYAKRFGLGERTDFIIKESLGLVPTRAWKMQNRGERWWKGETISTCIGQSYLQVTPLQVARMISAICMGYLVKPRILKNEDVQMKPLEIKEETLEFLRDAMKSSVEFGTSRRLKKFRKFNIYAKTGTAQTASLEKAQLEHGWFTCYFSYKNEKPLVIVSLVERAGTSLPALLMVKKFLSLYAINHDKL